ncbi:MAG: lycopene cyclase domain-containing protein [Candidatus Omnitrophota bacterium]|jgi:lycopene cyclase domain-containing protein|nr:MAG: lycopene cyclase domain-containing protein [Candidatus Omnitrophota bacterium]
MSKYLILLILSLAVPFLFSFWPELRFYKKGNLRRLFLSILFIVIIFGGWDIFATWRGHWSFDPDGVLGARIINLPLEEVLFFVVIPFCCIFTWESLKLISKMGGR